MAAELHLPDLPEVAISLGQRHAGVPRRSLGMWLRDTVSAYLPLLLLALLASGSWWLVKNAPQPAKPRPSEAVRSEPDYTMSRFVLERFTSDGRLKLRMQGAVMRHFPDTDRIEIDDLQLHAIAPDGRVTQARSRRALSNGDGSEVQLIGAARVDSKDRQGQDLSVSSEFLHLYTVSEKLRTHLPVLVQSAGAEIRAGAMSYEHALGRIELSGAQRASFAPRRASKPGRP
jgi:lipopolysaccharide export system protein LptC